MEYGPSTDFGKIIHAMKYRAPDESFDDYCVRYARTTTHTDKEFYRLLRLLRDQTVLPAGRQQIAVGRPHLITAFNCFVSSSIPDDTRGIFEAVRDAAITLRSGGGCGWDFSTLRPDGELVRGLGLGAKSSGPVSFMHVWNSMCGTIMSAGERRGAMMGVLRCDHPDIMKFVRAKMTPGALTNFNISVAATDEFMEAVQSDGLYKLRFEDRTYGDVRALDVWAPIMQGNWDNAEPGILFIDRINVLNPLNYCETIAATNPSMPAGTLVHTDRGVLPIHHLEGKKFKVKVITGEWADAKCFLSSKNADVLEIDLGNGRSIKSTPQHKWPVLLNGRYVKVETKDLKPGDMIPLNRNEPMGHSVRNDLTYEDGLIAGVVFGNGSYGVRKDDKRSYLSISFNREDQEMAEVAAAYFKCNISYRENETVINLSRTKEAETYIKKFGFGEKDHIPSIVWESNDSFVAGFVDGIFSTDGYVGDSVGNKSMVFTNKNESTVKDVGKLLGFHGIACSISSGVSVLNGKEYSRSDLRINHNSVKRFCNLFRLTSKRKQARLDKLCAMETREHIYSTHVEVRDVKKVGKAKVWDISVYHDTHVFPTEWCYTGNCAEQPLPPNGACLLGSVNILKLLVPAHETNGVALAAQEGRQMVRYTVDFDLLREAVDAMVCAFDTVIDRTIYPHEAQKQEAHAKRRMGVGVTGMANALEVMGLSYGTEPYIDMQSHVLREINTQAYRSSARLARERGPFPLWDAEKYCSGNFFKNRLPEDLKDEIRKTGLRNGLLTSIAPTGTISMAADNISSGIEPPYLMRAERDIITPEGKKPFEVIDAAFNQYGVKGLTAEEVRPELHVEVLCQAQKWVDSSISKTVNVKGQVGGEGPGTTYDEFKDLYIQAYTGGAKGCTTYNSNGKRAGILREVAQVLDEPGEGAACVFDVATGTRTCE